MLVIRSLVLLLVSATMSGCGNRGTAVAVPPEASWPDAATLTPPAETTAPPDAGPS
jgi:hypothetical protein